MKSEMAQRFRKKPVEIEARQLAKPYGDIAESLTLSDWVSND